MTSLNAVSQVGLEFKVGFTQPRVFFKYDTLKVNVFVCLGFWKRFLLGMLER
jgi:hypothetical protein